MAKKKKPDPVRTTEPRLAEKSPTSAPGWLERNWIPELILVAAAILVYMSSLDNGFVFFDDDKAILYNKTLQNPSLSGFFSGQNLGMYAPLSWIAYWLGQNISGQEAWGYHALGLVLHALNAVLAFIFLFRLTGLRKAAFFAALLFAVHPVQVEAVSWAAALSTVLFSTFYLSALLAYLKWRRSPTPLWLAASLLFFAAACLSKSAAVTVPLVLVAVDFYLDKKLLRKFWLSKIPFFLLSFVFGLYTFSTRAQEGHDIEATSAVFSAFDRFLMVSQTLLFYPVKLLLPLGFSVSYPFVKMEGVWPWTYYAAPVALLILGILIWKNWRNQPEYLFAIALYFLPLTVMLPFRTVGSFELRSDRYVYLSCLGLFFLAALLLDKIKPAVSNTILAAAAVVLGFLAFRQTSVWKDGVALFKNCADKTPESSLCQCNLAYNQLISLDFDGAIYHYSEALKYDPGTIEAYNGRGQAYLQQRQIPQALEDFNQAIAAGIVTPKLYLNRGKCLVMLNRPQEAIPDLTRSIELEPKSAETFYFRANARDKTGDLNGALEDYSQANRLRPGYVEALVNRGILMYEAGRFEEAAADYTAALGASTGNVHPMILVNRANAYLQIAEYAKALEDASRAIDLNPQYGRAYHTRGAIYLKMGQQGKAQADLVKAQQIQPK
ncbi:MAG: tetratricopeptide repeat protein [Saprospiraceae bacterium]|nr:tetratricopeptide repeat protein [Lewinellaceae bacterium]